MSSLKKFFVLGSILGVVLLPHSSFAWTLYHQLKWEDESYTIRYSEGLAVAQQLIRGCGLDGFPKSISLNMLSEGTTDVELLLRASSLPDQYTNSSWYSYKTITGTSTTTLTTFNFASSTMPDFSYCREDWDGQWFFQIRVVSGSPLYIFGTTATSTLSTDLYNIPTSYCVDGADGNCGTIGDNGSLYFYIDGDTSETGTEMSISALRSLSMAQCDDWGTIGGAFCKVLVALFAPSEQSLTQFSSLAGDIENKPPFGYFTSIKNYLGSLRSTSTPAFVLTTALEDIVFFNTLKTALVWILWLFFGFWVIKRISRFDF